MSIESMAIALHHSAATGNDLVVLLGIANHDGDGGSYPAVGTLAKYARFKGWDAEPVDDSKEAKDEAQRQRNNARRSARNACRRLEALGEVETVTNGGIGGRSEHERTNYYRITISCPPNCDRSAQHRLLDPEETRKRLRAALGLPAEPVDNSASDPRSVDSSPESGLPSPRSVDSSEPSNNHPIGNSLNYLVDNSDQKRDSESDDETGEDYSHWSPGEKIEAARKRLSEATEQSHAAETKHRKPQPAPRVPRFDPATVPAPEPDVSPEQQQANELAKLLPCPEGFGDTAWSRNHLILTRTGEGCARCGTDSFTILEHSKYLEVTP